MKRLTILSAAVAVSLAGLSCKTKTSAVTTIENPVIAAAPLQLSDEAAPANQPALPAGHPGIGEPKPAGALPSGHPDIAQAAPSAGAALPSGHPAIPQAVNRDAKPIDVTFNIQALQQTKGAAAVASLPATLEFFLDQQPAGTKVDFKLDDKGAASVPVKAVPTGAIGYITVKYQDVDYHAVSAPVDPTRPQTKVGIGVFESTDVKPDWQVAMQHVILAPDNDGLHVTEMISVENPTDKTWLGAAGSDGKRSTVTFPVPPACGDILPIEGFRDGFVKLDGDILINQLPLTPGATQYRLSYTIPYVSGHAAMNYKTTSAIKHMMLFTPDDGTQVEVKGLQSIGQQDMGEKKIRAFMAMNLPAGAPIELKIGQPAHSEASHDAAAHSEADHARESNMPAVASSTGWDDDHASPAAVVPKTASAMTVQIAKTVAVVGTVLVLLAAGALMLAKPNRVAKSK